MKRSQIFKRGQIWYWEDPVFGKKNEIEPSSPTGDATYRYNRYVIIVQTEDTIDSQSILVVPCSSTNHTPHDIQVSTSFIWHEGYCYAKCRSMFPVHPRMLQRYVCCITDEEMKLIDAELIKLVAPYITDVFSPSDVREWFGIDLEANPEPRRSVDSPSIEGYVRTFANQVIMFTGNPTHRITIKELKQAYDVFCINTSLPMCNDMLQFLDASTRVFSPEIMEMTSWKSMNRNLCDLTEFRGIRIRNDAMKVVVPVIKPVEQPRPIDIPKKQEPEQVPSNDTSKTNDWTDPTIVARFIHLYTSGGKEKAAKEFNISQSSALRYYYKFRDSVESSAAPAVTKVPLPSAKDIIKAVSKISNMTRDMLREGNVQGFYAKEMDPTEFYAKIQSHLYFSMLEFLGVRIDNSGKFTKTLIPSLGANSKHLDTWRFFDAIYHDKRISTEKNIVDTVNKYHSVTGRKICIEPEWKVIFDTRLAKLGFNKSQRESIMHPISSLLCE